MNRSTLVVLIALTLGIWANALRPVSVKAAQTTICQGGLTPLMNNTGYALFVSCH